MAKLLAPLIYNKRLSLRKFHFMKNICNLFICNKKKTSYQSKIAYLKIVDELFFCLDVLLFRNIISFLSLSKFLEIISDLIDNTILDCRMNIQIENYLNN